MITTSKRKVQRKRRLKTPRKSVVTPKARMIYEFLTKTRKPLKTTLKGEKVTIHYRNNRKRRVAVMVGMPIDSRLYGIGFALCNIRDDTFDKSAALGIAGMRAMKELEPIEVPEMFQEKFEAFEVRCRKYFADKERLT